MGGCGDYFDVADTVILMDAYRPRDVTARARKVADSLRTDRASEAAAPLQRARPRCPQLASIDASKGKRDVKIRSRGLDTISFGREEIALDDVEQIVDRSQTRAVGDAIHYCVQRYADGKTTLREIMEALDRDLDEHGLHVIDPLRDRIAGNYARPRRHEVAAAVNRLRTLRVI
jgi:predicted ABC-class ATPase